MGAVIHPLLKEQAVFEPEATNALAEAFDQVCASMNIPATADHEREVIATRIIDLAREGVLDPQLLKQRVLLESGSAT
jgi:hypothetical protein